MKIYDYCVLPCWVPIWGSFCQQRVTEIKAGVSNYIHGFLWEIITHPWPNCSSESAEPPLKSVRRWVKAFPTIWMLSSMLSWHHILKAREKLSTSKCPLSLYFHFHFILNKKAQCNLLLVVSGLWFTLIFAVCMYKINSEYNECCYFLNICISGNTKSYVETHNDLFCPQNACSEIWLMDRKGNKFISMICKLSGNLTANAGFKRDYEIGPCMNC